MGSNNKPIQKPNPSLLQPPTQKQPQKPASFIVENKQQVQYSIPQTIRENRESVRECINKYNQRIELEMKKQYVKDFFDMRQKLLKNMQSICKSEYSTIKAAKKPTPSKQFKQCMTSVQGLITQEDERMQQEFGVKLFLLADKCLIKEGRIQEKDRLHKSTSIDRCIEKLLKYRNLNMEMHILRLEMAREML